MRRPRSPVRKCGPGAASQGGTQRPFSPSFLDPAAQLQEGGEACHSADCVLAGAYIFGGEVVEGGRYLQVEVGADAAQDGGADDLDLCHCTHYGAPAGLLSPVLLFVEGVDNVRPVRW